MKSLHRSFRLNAQNHANDAFAKALEKSGLIDPFWYFKKYPDVAATEQSAVEHFARYGDRELRQPNPFFDVEWYLERNPDVKQAGIGPVRHYLLHGADENRDPHPFFSTEFYKANNEDVRRAGQNALGHFVMRWSQNSLSASNEKCLARKGGSRDLDPHPLFDTRWFLKKYAHLAGESDAPFAFYLKNCGNLDLDPHPLIDGQWYRRVYPNRSNKISILEDCLSASTAEVRNPSALFDRQWYMDTYGRDLSEGTEPLLDYAINGQSLGRLPHPMFATDWYLKKNADAVDYPGGAYCHFREIGAAIGLDPHPLFDSSFYVNNQPEASADPLGPALHFLSSKVEEYHQPHVLFDPRWYAACNPDPQRVELNAFIHFLGYGIWENPDPSPLFDTNWYLEQYPQSRKAFVHPIVHFIESGYADGYWPTAYFDPAHYVEKYPECVGENPFVHFARIGLLAGHSPNACSDLEWKAVPEPDVYGAGNNRLSRYVRGMGLITRLVLACEAVKKQPVAYDACLQLLMSQFRSKRLPKPSRDQPMISVVLPVYNGIHFTMACIDSIARFSPKISFELIVADNVSNDATQKLLSKRKDIRYIRHPENLGFLRSCNRAARFANGKFIFLLNNDTLVLPGWLDELFRTFSAFENVGLVGSKLIYPDGRLQEAGGIIWRDGSAWNFGKFQDPAIPEFNYVRETDYVSGAAIMLPKRLWDELEGFDEMFAPSYCEDSDLALRVRALGYSVLYSPFSIIAHFEGMTQGRDTTSGIKSFQVSNTEKLFNRWREYLSQLQHNGKDVDEAKDRGFSRRVLFLDNCTPVPKEDAGSVTALNMMKLLRNRGYQVTFIPQDNYLYIPQHTADLQRDGIEVLYGPFTNSVEQHLEQHGKRYDLVIMMRPDSYRRHFKPIKKYATKAKLIYHACDLHYLRFEREANLNDDEDLRKQAEVFKKIEFEAFRACDASIVHSTVEADIIRAQAPDLSSVHVFGWAIPITGSRTAFGERNGAVFVGGFNHGPNVDAVIFFVNEVLPGIMRAIPAFTFHIVGSKAPKEVLDLAGKHVIVHGFVDDIDPLLQACSVAVAPLRYGAGIKGKIATAMSAGLPNVVTTTGAEGMDLRDGDDCLIADDPRDFANAVIRLCTDQGLWNHISARSTEFAEANYGPASAKRIFDAILASVKQPLTEYAGVTELIYPTGKLPAQTWPKPLTPALKLTSQEDLKRSGKSIALRNASIRDKLARLALHDRPELGYPGFSEGCGKLVRFQSTQLSAPFGKESLRKQLVCPESGFNNEERLLIALASQSLGALPKAALGALLSEAPNLVEWAKTVGLQLRKFDEVSLMLVDSREKIDTHVAATLAEGTRPGGTLWSLEPDASSAFDCRNALQSKGWLNAEVHIYHAPDYGHLGDDLFVVRAMR